MKKIEKYNYVLKIINILLEVAIIIIDYWIATFFRFIIPFGKKFAIMDSNRFKIIAVVMAVIVIIATASFGGYASFRVYDRIKEAVSVAKSTFFGILAATAIIFSFEFYQFSRVLLLYCAILIFISIYIKRLFIDFLVKKWSDKYNVRNNVIMIGAGRLAQIAYRTIFIPESFNMRFLGYLSDSISEIIPNYLGKIDDLLNILSHIDVSMILIACDDISVENVRQIALLGSNNGVRTCIIPEYEAFIASKNPVSNINGNLLLDITARDNCNIMGVEIAVTNMEKTVEKIKDNITEWKGKYICISNVHTTVTASENADYKIIQNNAVMSLPDGGPLSAYSRKHGFYGAERVTGPDLMKRILIESASNGWKNYFYGSTQETLEKLDKIISERYPGAQICGMMSPPFRELTVNEDLKIVEEINRCAPDIVWVALGAPKQEIWMAAHEGRINALMIGVGAAFDYESGNIRRAPEWMQKRNLEWLYRLFQDPKRLFKRYLVTNFKFLWWKLFNSDSPEYNTRTISGEKKTAIPSLKIAMFGQKHLSREGGIEVVATEQALRMAAEGHTVVCYNRRTACPEEGKFNYDTVNDTILSNNICVRTVPTIKRVGFAALTSSFFAAISAAVGSYDIVHVHAEGPAVFCWIPKLFGKKVICQNHGLDHMRPKWGKLAKKVLKFGEKMSVRWSDELIVLSDNIAEYFKGTYGRDTCVIHNGISKPLLCEPNIIYEKWGLEKDSYILFLGRITEEKGLHYLIEAYSNIKTDKKLVIAGIQSSTNEYKKRIMKSAGQNTDIIFTGFVQGVEINELYSNCYIYVLPSDLEGMSMSLLEAMSYGACCLVSDIPENISVVGDRAESFKHGDVPDLIRKLRLLLNDKELVSNYKENAAEYVCSKYNWDDSVSRLLKLYNR